MEQKQCEIKDVPIDSAHVNLADVIRTLHQKSLSPKSLESLCIEYSASNVQEMFDWHEKLNLRKF